jgi:hypothetical protein
VTFLVKGKNFQTGTDTAVTFIDPLSDAKMTATVLSTTTTDITGTLAIPAGATTGTYDLFISTTDGGSARKGNTFKVSNLPLPTVASINQSSGFRNSTVNFLVTGKFFQPEGTSVRLFLNDATTPIETIVVSVTDTKITGRFTIPANQPVGKYRVDVSTVSGGSGGKFNAFTINVAKAATIGTITPATTVENTTVAFTLKGTGFQTTAAGGTTVTFWNKPANLVIQPTIVSITPTEVVGSAAIPNAYNGSWYVNVTTADGGLTSKPSAFTVTKPVQPAIKAFTPKFAYRGTTFSFVMTGTSFQTDGRTAVSLAPPGQTEIPTVLTSITSSQIAGYAAIPDDAATGAWTANVTTINGGSKTLAKAVTVM